MEFMGQLNQDDRVLLTCPFESKRKMGSIVVKTDSGVRVYCKGAPDFVLEKTTHCLEK